MRGLKSTIALVVILAGLGAYIYFIDAKRPAGDLEPKEKVFTVEAEKIEEIRLTTENETSVLQKVDGTWRIAEPEQADADQTEISSLTTNISTLEVNRVVDDNAADLAQYGLSDPKIKLAFKGQGGAAGEIHLGEKTPTQSDVYAVRPGEKRVFLVSGFQETTFNKKPFDLRDKRILRFERDKVDALEIAHGGEVIQLARDGSEWVVRRPVAARGDYGAIEGLLTRLSTASMTKLVDRATPGAASLPEGGAAAQSFLAGFGLDKPSVTLTVGAGSARAALVIGREANGEAYARDQARPMVFTIDSSLVSDLKKTVDEYRDKNVFEFRAFNLARLRITRGADTYEFQKVAATEPGGADRWQRTSSGGAGGGALTDVDAVKMDDFLTKLANLQAQSFAQTPPRGEPALVAAVSYDEGKFERVRFGRAGADVLATREGEPGAARIQSTAYEETLKALDAVVTVPPAQAAPSQ